jgi:hypothetical protein
MTKTALLSIALAFAACSKTSPSTPASGSMAAPREVGHGSAAPTPPPRAPDASPAPTKGPRMSAADEVIITKHYEKKGWGKPLEIVTFEHVPGMYAVEFSDGGDYGVIRDGKILEGKGLDAAGAYMRDVKLLTLSPSPRDLTTLLEIFGALPPLAPGAYASPDQFYNYDKHTALNPKLELGPAGGKLVLNYLVPHRGGAIANANLARVMRWTLTIPPSYKLAWREEETKFDMGSP